LKILSLLWGFSLGGIGKCALTYACLNEFPEISLKTVCIYGENWACDLSPLKEIGADLLPIKGRTDFSWVGKCIKKIKDYSPDVLFVHGFNGPVIAKILQLAMKKKVPFVCSYHGFYHPPSWSRIPLAPIFNRTAEYIYRKYADGVVSVCAYSKNALIDRGVSAEKVTVVHNGLPEQRPDFIGIDRSMYGLSDNDIVIGVASRLDPVKGLPFLLAAFSRLVAMFPEAKLVMVGDGSCSENLKDQCRKLGVSNSIFFVGYQDNVEAWLELFDIFALPSLAEYHSIALLEGMRAAKAIVATDVGGNTESVRHEQEALIVPPRDPEALEKAISMMLNNVSLRKRLGRNAKSRFEENFTEEVMLKKLALWLQKCVEHAVGG